MVNKFLAYAVEMALHWPNVQRVAVSKLSPTVCTVEAFLLDGRGCDRAFYNDGIQASKDWWGLLHPLRQQIFEAQGIKED